MKDYSGLRLTPLFYSEISSSYMLYDIFENHRDILSKFVEQTFNVVPEIKFIQRERQYPQKGSIDIFIEFIHSGKEKALLIEVKVHDYLSVTYGQIGTYYNAVMEQGVYDEVYFIYLTQFTTENDFTGIVAPKTLDEASRGKQLIKDRFAHLSWEQMHSFLDRFLDKLTEEQRLIVSLNKQWIQEKCKADLESNKIEVGERGIEDYFVGVNIDIRQRLNFGKEVSENKRQILRIYTSNLDEQQLDSVFGVINILSASSAVNKTKKYPTEEQTLVGAKEFLTEMAHNAGDWKILSFYAKLFMFIEMTSYLKFNGTGTRGFSIKLEIQGKGEISLCTIYRNKTIDFSLKR